MIRLRRISSVAFWARQSQSVAITGRRPKRDAEASGEGGNDADARPSATLSGRGLFRHDGVERLGRIADTPCGPLLVMAKNASGRMVQPNHIVL